MNEPTRTAARPRADLSALARGSLLTLGGSAASSVLGFVLVVVITRGLPSQRAGVLFEAIALFTIASNLAELGADTGLVRTVARWRALGRHQDIAGTLAVALWPVFAAGVVLGASLVVLAPDIADLVIRRGRSAEAVTYIRLFALFLPLSTAMTVALAGTRGFGTMVPSALVQNLVVPALRPLMVGLAVATGAGTTAVGLGWAIPVAGGFAAALWWLFGLLGREESGPPGRRWKASAMAGGPPGPRPIPALAAEFWRFSIPRALAVVLTTLLAWLDVLLVGALRSAREAAIYAAVTRLVGIGRFTLQAAGLAVAPQVSALLARDDREGAESVFQTSTWWIMTPAWPVYVMLATFSPFLLRVFGQEFAEGRTALVVLSLAMMVLVGTGNNKIVMLMGGRSAWNLIGMAASLTINVVLNLLLIPKYGIEGAAVAYAASIVVDNAITTGVVWWQMGLQPFGVGYPVVALASILCYGAVGLAVRTWLGMSLPTLALFLLVATTVYLGVLWRFRGVLRFSELRDALLSRRASVGHAPMEPD